MGRPGRPPVFQEPAHPGASGRRVRPRARHRPLPESPRAGPRGRGAGVQVRCPVVSARRGRAGPPSGQYRVSAVADASAPRLHAKARLQRDDVRGRDVLLYPEGLVTLNATGVEILKLCDGTRSLADIVAMVERRYETTGLAADVRAFLEGLAAKGLVTYGP